jgi:putative tryptophan/tyrosine transport system substrate-binding protein
MQRRTFISLIGGAIASWPLAARAQEPGKTYRVGLLATGGAIGPSDERRQAILEVLAAHGFVEGRNLAFVARWGDGRYDRLSEYAVALKASKVDVIVTFGYPAALAAKMSAKDVPVVVSGAGDPVATGLVESLARPGGTLTGSTELATELSAKRLEILKEAVPNLRKVAVLFNATDHGMTLRYRAAEAAAQVLNVHVQTFGVREPNDFEDAFAEMTRSPPEAILMVSDALTLLNRKKIMEFAAAKKLPAIFEFSFLVRDGGLMSYGPNQAAIGARVGDFVARILGGARPADLPLEQPTQFELVINLKTAKALGLELPPTLLSRADEVIE